MQQELQKIGNSLDRMEAVLVRVAAALEILSTRETQALAGATKEQGFNSPFSGFSGSQLVNSDSQEFFESSSSVPLQQQKTSGGIIQTAMDTATESVVQPTTSAYERAYYAEYEGPQRKLQSMADELSKSGVTKSEDEWRQYAQFYQRTEFAAWQKNTEAVSVVTSPMQEKTRLTNEVGTEIFEIVKVVRGYIDSMIGSIAK